VGVKVRATLLISIENLSVHIQRRYRHCLWHYIYGPVSINDIHRGSSADLCLDLALYPHYGVYLTSDEISVYSRTHPSSGLLSFPTSTPSYRHCTPIKACAKACLAGS
jgi:hypothetical protein